ncbi:MAG TPA: EamA family transporter [Clostridia bacterium]|nr:EamA family transporter [Clostridia bacterium]
MWLYYLALALTVVSSVFYHIIQKSTPADVNPIISIFITYAAAISLCVLAYPFFRSEDGFILSFKKLNWTSYALGLAIFGIELGFLLAYRAGWNISLANIISAVAVTLVLILAGITIYHEKLTAVNCAGLLLCLIGIVLIKI